jgi:hypothetical protein
VVDRLTSVGRQLLPVFFVLAGFQLDLTGIGLPGLGELAAILAVAVIGKAGGTYLAARLHGLQQEEAATLAVLMNTRGLTEIVVLSIGLQVGILDHRLYSLLVIMALATTAMTGPLLSLIRRSARREDGNQTAVAPQPSPASAHGPGGPNRIAGGHAPAGTLAATAPTRCRTTVHLWGRAATERGWPALLHWAITGDLDERSSVQRPSAPP